MVGVADEIHQAYVPGRNASVADVFLDVVGIVWCLFVVKRLG
jgi:VanZ family protein